MRALVTGATGFLGRSLVRRLIRQGHDATALVRPRTRSQPDPVEELRGYGATIVTGTVFDAAILAEALANTDVIFHLGGQWSRPSVSGSPNGGSAAEQWHVNVEGTRLLIEAAQQAAVKRLIFTSTVFVYPATLPSPIMEDGPTFTPETLSGKPAEDYVAPKLAIEEMIRYLLPPANYVILRPSTIYGIGAQFAAGMVKGNLNTPPRRMVQPVNLVHVDDVARAAMLAAETPQAGGMTFNIAGRETVGSDQLREAINLIVNRQTGSAKPSFRPIANRYDIAKASRHLGFESAISLADGLDEMVTATLPEIFPPPTDGIQWPSRFRRQV
jgi:nucleoside-diphosphate-sugar epimerase